MKKKPRIDSSKRLTLHKTSLRQLSRTEKQPARHVDPTGFPSYVEDDSCPSFWLP